MYFEIVLVSVVALGLALWIVVDEALHQAKRQPALRRVRAGTRRRRAFERAHDRRAA
jgi:hypothetical protein